MRADPSALLNVAGTYRYSSQRYALIGTIRLTQTDQRVHVIETTYANAEDDRPLMGDADLVGNQLDIELVPLNGDADYRAQVGFRFDSATGAFCVTGFSDTNGDYGGPGSYRGEKI